MPISAKLERMRQVAVAHGGPARTSPDLFHAFVSSSIRQLRAPYLAHYETAEAVEQLASSFGHALRYRGPAPLIAHELHGNSLKLWTVMPDQPFIVDTIRLLLRAQRWEYVAGFNLMVPIHRSAAGEAQAIGSDSVGLESITFLEAEVPDPAEVPAALADLATNLLLCQAMVSDYHDSTSFVDSMVHRFSRLADHLPDQAASLHETGEFLRWLLSDNFVFMGVASGDQRFGVCAPAIRAVWPSDRLLSGWNDLPDRSSVQVRKGHQESRVHRAGRVDEIRVEVPHEDGTAPTWLFLQGLFTYRAVTQSSRHVPWLRRLLGRILARQDSKPGSYRYKGIANVFDSLPTEFIFTASDAEVAEVIERVLEAEQQQDARAQIVQRPGEDSTFTLVAMPKARWNEELRGRMQAMLLASTGATYADSGVFMGRFDTMLAYFFLTGGRALGAEALAALQDSLVELATPWVDRLYETVQQAEGHARASEVVLRWAEAFDEDYRRRCDASRTLVDIVHLEELAADHAVSADLYLDGEGTINLRIYQARDVLLSDMLPVLDDFGLIVIDQYANTVRLKDQAPMILDTFRLKGVWNVSNEDVLARRQFLIDGVQAVFDKHVDTDMLNRIVLRADIPWQAVDMLRAYLGYARQLGMGYTLVRFQELLLHRPDLLHNLWQLFQARFDPDLDVKPAERERSYAELSERFIDALRAVDDHDQDMVFRTLHNLIDSTLRTNFYRTDRCAWYISYKVDCAKVWHMPEPRMMYEIYVHHRVVEGLHLRGGPIARGGIRWSDRSDYRREILDLVTTQMVKNVLIVPEGAKGGFFIKKPVADRAARRMQADDMYEFLIRGLLDLTDNIKDGKVVHPPRVLRLDGDDPYLVVAADKGTAHLSDRANGICRSYGFWLDDAFASGGSHGYDHKVVGITARGGWMTVSRHFREMGKDPYKQDFTCIGVGDPAGDVFGNGMIETPHLRLLAAFNHMHVFLDPNPGKNTHKELVRLFNEAKGWDAFNTSLISKGGGIYLRRAKSIQLSPEVQKMLGTLKEELSVDAVIRLILRMDVDLLWNGGIGTYVKASTESHQQAKDPTNDEVRINADELRCRIVGEGGNLGFTPEARIEYALNGGRLNTDAIDNSGGVDMSDHEVNLKILVGAPVARGELNEEQRNTLLESLTDTVARQVLANNDTHGRQISLDQIRSARDPLFFWPTIQWVETRGGRSIADLHLPSNDVLRRRTAARLGLTRPELSVLQAHVKMRVFKDLMKDDPALIPGFDELVRDYFPAEIHERLKDDIDHHMLHRHIGMTVVTTMVCGDAGATCFPSLMELTGASAARTAAAWFRAMDLVDAAGLRAQLHESVKSQESRYRAWIGVTDAALGLVATWLAPGEPAATPEELVAIREVLGRLPKIRGTAHTERLRSRVKAFKAQGISSELASHLAGLGELTVAREIACLHDGKERLADTITRYLAIGEASRLLPAVRALELRRTQDRWDPVAMGILRNRYIALMRELCRVVPVSHEVRLGVDRLAVRLARSGSGALEAMQDEMDRILGDEPDLATLLVAEERVRAWIARFPRT